MDGTVVEQSLVANADDLAIGAASSSPTAVSVMVEEVLEQENRTPPSATADGLPAAAATAGEPLAGTAGEVLVTPSHEPATGEAAAQAAAPTVEKPLVVALEDPSSSGFDKQVNSPAEVESLPDASAEASTVAAQVVGLGGGPVAGGVPAVSEAASEAVKAVAGEPAQATSEPEQPASTAELEGLPDVAHAAHVDPAAGMAGSSECGSVVSDEDPEVVEVECKAGGAAGQEGRVTADVGESGEAPPTCITTPEEATENTPIIPAVHETPAAGEGQPVAAIMPTASEGASGTIETEQVASGDKEATTGEREVEHPAPGASEAAEASVADVEVASPGSLEDKVILVVTSSCGQKGGTSLWVGDVVRVAGWIGDITVAAPIPPSTCRLLVQRFAYTTYAT